MHSDSHGTEKGKPERGIYGFLLCRMRPFRALAFLSIGCGTVAAVFNGVSVSLVVPLALALVGETPVPEGGPTIVTAISDATGRFLGGHTLGSLALAVFGAVLCRNAALMLHSVAAQRAAYRLARRLRHDCLDLLLRVDLTFFSRAKRGEILHVVAVESSTTAQAGAEFLMLASRMLTVLLFVGLLFLLSIPLTLLTATLLAGVALVNRLLAARGRRLGAETFARGRDFTSALEETLSGMREIRSLHRESDRLRELNALVEARENTFWRFHLLYSGLTPLNDFLAIGALLGVAVLGNALLPGTLRALPVSLLLYLVILVRLLPILLEVSRHFTTLRHSEAGMSAVRRLLDPSDKPFLRNGARPYEGFRREIRFENVTFGYPGEEQPVLRGLDFAIPCGATVALIGTSGAGKSTVADLLARFFDPDDGRILIDGVDLREFQLDDWRRALSVVSQDPFLFHESIAANLLQASPRASRVDMEEATRRTQALDFIQRLPRGFDTVVGDRGERLSGGERQRIVLAQAILRNPHLLILDEATGALDSVSERLVREAVRDACTGRTVLLIAHRMRTVEDADMVLVLENGQIVEQGTPAELARTGPRYRRFREEFHCRPEPGDEAAAPLTSSQTP